MSKSQICKGKKNCDLSKNMVVQNPTHRWKQFIYKIPVQKIDSNFKKPASFIITKAKKKILKKRLEAFKIEMPSKRTFNKVCRICENILDDMKKFLFVINLY